MLRATAWRKLENLDLARDDIERALAVSPGNTDALLERGNIRSLRGDAKGAAADWEAVVAAQPGPSVAEARGKTWRNLKRSDWYPGAPWILAQVECLATALDVTIAPSRTRPYG